MTQPPFTPAEEDTVTPPTMPPILTRSLPTRPDWNALLCDIVTRGTTWRLAYMPEASAAFWCVPGSRRLGLAVVVGRC